MILKWFHYIAFLLLLSFIISYSENIDNIHFNKLTSIDSSRLSIGIGTNFKERVFLLSSIKLSSNLDGLINFDPISISEGLYYSIGIRFYMPAMIKKYSFDLAQVGINRYRRNSIITRWIDLSVRRKFKIRNLFFCLGYSLVYNSTFTSNALFAGVEKSIGNLLLNYWFGYRFNNQLINMFSISYKI